MNGGPEHEEISGHRKTIIEILNQHESVASAAQGSGTTTMTIPSTPVRMSAWAQRKDLLAMAIGLQ